MKYSVLRDKYLWVVLVSALVIRLYTGFTTFVITTDAVPYIDQAKNFVEGTSESLDYSRTTGLESSYHPLYPFLIAVLFKCINNYEISAKAISMAMGVSLAAIVYIFGKRIFDSRIAFLCAILVAFHPYAARFSAEILSESTYFFFFTLAIGLGYIAVRNLKLLYYIGTGMSSALAYLARPEGVGVLVIVGFFTVFWRISNVEILWSRRLWCLTVMLLAFFMLASPYLIYIKRQTGYWTLTKKKNLTELLGFENITERAASVDNRSTDRVRNESIRAKPQGKIWNAKYKKYFNTLSFMISKFVSTYNPLLLLFLIIGLIKCKKVPISGMPGVYLGFVLAFYVFILYALALVFSGTDHYYLSRRHLMPLVIPTMFCSAIGVQTLCNWLEKKSAFQSARNNKYLNVNVILPVIIICLILPKTLKFHRTERIGAKEAGYWLKENTQDTPAVIMGITPRIAYYAGGKHVYMNPGSYSEMISNARSSGVKYIEVYKEKITSICPDFFESINSEDIELAYQHTYKDRSKELNLLLYRILY